jgi:hypothetical protein
MMEHQATDKTSRSEHQEQPLSENGSTAQEREPLSTLLQLQQRIGNRAVGRLLQTKLEISRPGDAYEQEAERVSERVMRMPEPRAAQEDVAVSEQSSVQHLHRVCHECEEEWHGEHATVHRREAGAPGAAVGGGQLVEEQLASLKGGGQPLPDSARAFFEPRFGYDFSHVRLHTGPLASDSARAVNALAFTVGPDIVFGAGQYAPETTGGQHLLAHELTHVVQQGDHSALRKAAPTNAVLDAPAAALDEEENQPEEEAAEPEPPAAEMLEADAPPEIRRMPVPGLLTVQRQPSGIPPPPPDYPSALKWGFNPEVKEARDTAWYFTCKDGLERGFVVMWDEKKDRIYPNEMTMGTKKDIVWSIPADRKPIFPVGLFHTHPPIKPGWRRALGPSQVDKDTSAKSHLPGIVEDYQTQVSDCRKAGLYFYGPTVRD